jgi:hypothetical protein
LRTTARPIVFRTRSSTGNRCCGRSLQKQAGVSLALRSPQAAVDRLPGARPAPFPGSCPHERNDREQTLLIAAQQRCHGTGIRFEKSSEHDFDEYSFYHAASCVRSLWQKWLGSNDGRCMSVTTHKSGKGEEAATWR